ncbi:NitT/TauT family transport system substrate-binding protein [Marinobacterium mangrovicola]|uniref:NitT/TauT family transport system substrate-binding protein n=2 Tax=Marinobacterium mangrovicola TaxID=1476959 RepID=A0A4R1GFU4_9GAMM|nr:NitT/TauT family transport system substrate-binding protein [Marinobacterium mangrovicola]
MGIIRNCLAYLMIMLALSGCAEDSKPLRLGAVLWPGYEPLFLARSQGDLEEERVGLVELLSTGEVMRGVRNGALDVAALTLDEALLLAQDVEDLKILLVTDTSYGADAILADGEMTMSGLKGKRVGVDSTALGAYFLSRALAESGMSESDIIPVSLSVDMHESAFLNDEVDAVVTFEPIRSRLLGTGANQVFSSRDIPNEIIDLLVVRGAILKDREESVRYLIDAWYSGVRFLREKPQEAYGLMSERLGLTEEQVETSLEGLSIPDRKEVRSMLYDNNGIRAQADRLERLMIAEGLLTEQVQLDDIVVARSLWD